MRRSHREGRGPRPGGEARGKAGSTELLQPSLKGVVKCKCDTDGSDSDVDI